MPKKDMVAVLKSQGGAAAGAAAALTVKDDEGYTKASELLGNIKKVQKYVKGESDKVMLPLREAKRQAQQAMDAEAARWLPIANELNTAESIVKEKMVRFVNEREKAREDSAERILDRVSTGTLKPETAVRKIGELAAAPKKTVNENGGSQVVKKRVVKIVDREKVPDEYWQLNEVAVRRDALAGKEIPGVEVVVENTIAGLTA